MFCAVMLFFLDVSPHCSHYLSSTRYIYISILGAAAKGYRPRKNKLTVTKCCARQQYLYDAVVALELPPDAPDALRQPTLVPNPLQVFDLL